MIIDKIFAIATFEEYQIVDGIRNSCVHGDTIRYSITKEQYQLFARMIIQNCIDQLHEVAEDIGNGNIFNGNKLLARFEESWSAGIYYGAENLEEKFLKDTV